MELINDDLAEKYYKYFHHKIIERGEDYYEYGNVKRCIKTNDTYISKVIGEKLYTVKIVIKDDKLKMSCDCPYEKNCKHEYATLLAIDNKEYDEIELLKEEEKKTISIKELLSKIPAKELKEYILKEHKNIIINETSLEETFIKYLPIQSYEYYYNTLYNNYKIEESIYNCLTDYQILIKNYITKEEYIEAFKIVKSIIDVTNDLNIDITESYPVIGMYLRICNRKGSIQLKEDINKYINELELKKYNNNCYLEDIILTINII